MRSRRGETAERRTACRAPVSVSLKLPRSRERVKCGGRRVGMVGGGGPSGIERGNSFRGASWAGFRQPDPRHQGKQMNTEPAKAACVTSVADAPLHVGQKVGPTEWRRMTQEQVNQFAEVTGDRNFIHVDPERARRTAFGGTIAHGYLTLSLLGHLAAAPGRQRRGDVHQLRPEQAAFPRGRSRWARVPRSWRDGRGHAVRQGRPGHGHLHGRGQGRSKPALVAECLFRYYR